MQARNANRPVGSPFTNPTGTLPAPDAHSFKVLDHALNVLFSTPFTSHVWHNFAIEVDWTARTLAVLYSQGPGLLQRVTRTVENPTVPAGADGQGDFHFGVLKVGICHFSSSMQSTHACDILNSRLAPTC